MKINDIAKRLNVTARAIRLYEDKGLLKPVRDAENRYRYYTEQDAWRLQTIASLRDIGLSLNQIGRILEKFDQGNAAEIHHYLELQRSATVSKWVELKHVIATVDELISRFEAKQRLDLDDLFRLAASLNQIRRSSSWQDKWDFDLLADRYDQSAAMYAAGSLISMQDYDNTLQFIVQWVAPQNGEQGLDIGTGTGNLAGKLLDNGAEMYAIDQSKEMLSRCRRKFPGLKAKLGNAMSVPFLDKQFHFVVSAFTFHHLDEAQQMLALEEMNRVLAPNGRICIAGLMFDSNQTQNKHAFPAALSGKHPSDRSKLLEWFRDRQFITVQHQLNEWVHVVYAVRKN